MTTNIIKVIALIIAASALYPIIGSWDSIWWGLAATLQGQDDFSSLNKSLWFGPTTIILYVIILFKLIAAHGLFRLKSWGRTLTIGVLFCDFLIKLLGAVNIWTYYWRHPEALEMIESLQASSQDVHVQTVSMWPSYISGVFSLICIVFLLRQSTKEKFLTN